MREDTNRFSVMICAWQGPDAKAFFHPRIARCLMCRVTNSKEDGHISRCKDEACEVIHWPPVDARFHEKSRALADKARANSSLLKPKTSSNRGAASTKHGRR